MDAPRSAILAASYDRGSDRSELGGGSALLSVGGQYSITPNLLAGAWARSGARSGREQRWLSTPRGYHAPLLETSDAAHLLGVLSLHVHHQARSPVTGELFHSTHRACPPSVWAQLCRHVPAVSAGLPDADLRLNGRVELWWPPANVASSRGSRWPAQRRHCCAAPPAGIQRAQPWLRRPRANAQRSPTPMGWTRAALRVQPMGGGP